MTANNSGYTGIHPLVALESHRANLAPLLQKAIACMRTRDHGGEDDDAKPDFVAVTRGPGMRSNLSVGLDTAKGLATAWNVPLVGVHHMQAHALTSRLATLMETEGERGYSLEDNELKPTYPFLTVLASGGHTMLIDSAGLTEHTVLADSQDIALGEFLDKAARVILPTELLKAPYGKALEGFAFQSTVHRRGQNEDLEMIEDAQRSLTTEYIRSCPARYKYEAPKTQQELMERRSTDWGWSLTPPLTERKGGESKRMEYSFAGLLTFVERLVKHASEVSEMGLQERQDLAREVQRIAFEHLASRVMLHLTSAAAEWKGDTVVVSGGVASNKFLRHLLRKTLDARGYGHIELSFPPVALCTDNALMIAWAAIEMYEAGWESSLDIGPIRKWSMDPKAPDGGILGVDGWVKRQKDEDE